MHCVISLSGLLRVWLYAFFEYRIQKADIVIFVDMPRYKCFYRVFKRALSCYGKEFFSSATGCPERLPNLKFLRFIWNFLYKQKKQIEPLLATHKDQKKIFVVKSEAELSEFVKNI